MFGPLLTTAALAQQLSGFTIVGQDARLAGHPRYLLPPVRSPAPDVYWLRVDHQEPPLRVSLPSQGAQLIFRVAEAAASTRLAPRYYLLPSGSPEAELLLALAHYVALRG